MQQFGSFLVFFAQTYYQGPCLRSAAALCFTTLLSLVPLATVILMIFTAFPSFDSFSIDIQNFIFNNFVPTSGNVVQENLTVLIANSSNLTGIGIAMLILSALLLMDTIEGTLNDIWDITSKRKAAPRFMVYWAVLTLGPLLIGVSLAGTSYLAALPLLNETAIILETKSKLLGVLPFFATTLACTLLYAIVPNTYVPLRNAVVGAVVAAILFELAKKGFAMYITTFPTYQVIYGALAAIPIFLIWIYISWMVVLIGAELSYCMTHFSYAKANRNPPTAGESLLHDFRTLGLIWQAQRNGHPATIEQLLQGETLLNEVALDDSLLRLESAQLIHHTEENVWALSKNMSTLTLADLYHAQHLVQPAIDPEWLADDPWYQALHATVNHTTQLTTAAQNTPLQTLYSTTAQQQLPNQK